MWRTNKLIVTCSLLLVVLLQACGGTTTEQKKDKILVVSTTGMIDDAVANIAGDLVEHTSLMGPGVDPHLYKATQGDLSRLTKADLILFNGLHLEGKMGEIFEKLSRQKNICAVADSLDEHKLRISSEFNNGKDPHVWFNVALWMDVVQVVEASLIAADPSHADTYKANAAAYLKKLDVLHEDTRRKIASIPVKQRMMVTAHDAFGYFSEAYGIEVKGLQGISTMSEYGLKDISNMVQLLTDKKIKAVFVESSVSPKALNAVIEGCEHKGHNLVIGGELFSDAMGDASTPEGTYIGMVKHNVETITNALK